MKFIKLLFFTVLATVFMCSNVICAQAGTGYEKSAEFSSGRLSIISYSHYWGEKDLEELYTELVSNTLGSEFPYLRSIFIYPDSPYGIHGAYFEDIMESAGGKFLMGNNCYIELYDGDTKNSVEDMAHVLSHEYGHHFTIFNMMVYENNHYRNWDKSEYAALRELDEYPIIYSRFTASQYSSKWDITEIAANDYVQLLGSELAKKSHRYLDARQFVELGKEGVSYLSWHFNSKPQENLELDLAAQVSGLYEYFMKISGNGSLPPEHFPQLEKPPQITKLDVKKAFINKTYTISFNKAEGNGPFEYTVLLYPKELINIPAALKTLNDGQPLEATFGTLLKEVDNGRYLSVLDYYGGLCELRVFAKDVNGFIYSSEPFNYDFGGDFFDVKNYLAQPSPE